MGKDERWSVWAPAWELAALSFRYPEPALVDAVASGEWADAAREIAASLGAELPAGFDEEARAAHEALASEGDAALKTEATRLFVGAPHAACSPYEGIRRSALSESKPLLFVNRYAMEVERFCKACGFGHPEGTNEPLDHVATECELLERLALAAAGESESGSLPDESPAADEGEGGGLPDEPPAAAYERFVREHAAVWFREFADALAATTTHPFYRAAAMYLESLALTLE